MEIKLAPIKFFQDTFILKKGNVFTCQMSDDKLSIPSAITDTKLDPTDPSTQQMLAQFMMNHPDGSIVYPDFMDNKQGDHNKEKERIQSRLGNFNPKDNHVWRTITQRFGANIKQPELLSIAQVLASGANVKLDRDAKRRKGVLIKWFEENWN